MTAIKSMGLLRIVGMTLVTVVSASCGGGSGGGGSGSTAPAAVTPSLTPTSTKLFRFSWADVADETEYRLLENANGSSGFTQVATIAADTTTYDHSVFLPRRVNASYIVQACNGAGCSDSTPVTVSGTLATAVGYVKASNTEASDWFGWSVPLAADGNTLAVGADREDSNAPGIGGDQTANSAADSGAVYLY